MLRISEANHLELLPETLGELKQLRMLWLEAFHCP